MGKWEWARGWEGKGEWDIKRFADSLPVKVVQGIVAFAIRDGKESGEGGDSSRSVSEEGGGGEEGGEGGRKEGKEAASSSKDVHSLEGRGRGERREEGALLPSLCDEGNSGRRS